MNTHNSNDIIGQVAEALLKVSTSIIKADSYSFYLYDDLFIPVANYFPHVHYDFLNNYPVSKETPLVDYMQQHRRAVHNYVPQVKELWARNPRSRIFKENKLEFAMVAPLFSKDHWMGSINFARIEPVFNEQELKLAESVANMIVLFFENSEKLFMNNAYITMDSGDESVMNITVHNVLGHRGERAVESLTEREKEVMDLLVEGYSYTEMSDHLFVSINTVKFHVKNIYRKMGTNSRNRLIRFLYGKP